MANKDCYSFNEEWFHSGDLADAVEEYVERELVPSGSELVVYMGVSNKPLLEDVIHLGHLVDESVQYVYDNYGEIAADCFYEDLSTNDEKDLVSHLEAAVRQWRINNNFEVSFFEVSDVEEVRVRVINCETYEYEVINEH